MKRARLRRVGERVVIDGEEYIVANVGPCLDVALICLKDGIRWDEPIAVKDIYAITPREWARMVLSERRNAEWKITVDRCSPPSGSSGAARRPARLAVLVAALDKPPISQQMRDEARDLSQVFRRMRDHAKALWRVSNAFRAFQK